MHTKVYTVKTTKKSIFKIFVCLFRLISETTGLNPILTGLSLADR